MYDMKRVEEGKLFFIPKKSSRQLVLSLLNTHKGILPTTCWLKVVGVVVTTLIFPFIRSTFPGNSQVAHFFPLLLFLFTLRIQALSSLLSCSIDCFPFDANKGDRRQSVEWLLATKFKQVRLALLLLASSRHYKTLLTKQKLQGVYHHPDKFIRTPLPLLRTSSCNFDSQVHKVFKHLNGALGEGGGVKGRKRL